MCLLLHVFCNMYVIMYNNILATIYVACNGHAGQPFIQLYNMYMPCIQYMDTILLYHTLYN
jgi:hypothetical protein